MVLQRGALTHQTFTYLVVLFISEIRLVQFHHYELRNIHLVGGPVNPVLLQDHVTEEHRNIQPPGSLKLIISCRITCASVRGHDVSYVSSHAAAC